MPTPAYRSVELWSPVDPDGGSCELKDYPRSMDVEPTADIVSGELVACFEDSCEIYHNGEWNHLVETREIRRDHSSAVKDNRLLLIGGYHHTTLTSTEWISLDGSPSQPGPFNIRHGQSHCTLQISNEKIIITGGKDTELYVTEYQLTGDGNETPLTPMRPRRSHACGVYQGVGGEQVRRVYSYLWTEAILMISMMMMMFDNWNQE